MGTPEAGHSGGHGAAWPDAGLRLCEAWRAVAAESRTRPVIRPRNGVLVAGRAFGGHSRTDSAAMDSVVRRRPGFAAGFHRAVVVSAAGRPGPGRPRPRLLAAAGGGADANFGERDSRGERRGDHHGAGARGVSRV